MIKLILNGDVLTKDEIIAKIQEAMNAAKDGDGTVEVEVTSSNSAQIKEISYETQKKS